jgi:hypothetical protein
MPFEPQKDAELWRDRVRELRSEAEGMLDQIAKRQLLEIAELYDRLAGEAEERAERYAGTRPLLGL